MSEEGRTTSMNKDDSENLNSGDFWHNYEGKCQSCGIYGPIDDMSLCDECAGKLERDLIRQRDWNYSVSAFGLPGKERQKLRNNVIKKYGEALELIMLSDKAGKKRPSRLHKKRNT